MGLIDLVIGPSTNFVTFEANSAAEMQQKLRNWIADNAELDLWDADLVGGGAAPRFACTLTVGGAEGQTGAAIIAAVGDLQAYAFGGMDPIPPPRLTADLVTAISGDAILNKTLLAAGGVGPHWMAIALTQPS